MRAALIAIGLTALATVARAEVIDAQPNGFEVRRTVTVNAPPAKVYAALIGVGGWWNHTFSGNPANLSIEPRAGGCWCEALPKTKGSVAHMRVIYVDPGSLIRFEGSLGPMQETGSIGHLTWAVAAKDGGTQLTWTYAVGGYMRGGLTPMAGAVDGVFAEQMGRLKALVETGKPG
ncbi:MAG: activator of ATPase 1 family protein [Caulobacteraceae bacterium]|nr:activator of ATPase 1 family protein [Caulobacteraceae bacterium]